MPKSEPPPYSPPSGTPQYLPPIVAPPPAFLGQNVTVTSSYPQVVRIPVLGPHSQVLQCSSCHAMVTTRVKAESSSKTHIVAAILCLVSCCCLPYLIDSCKDRNHYCPNCNSFIGKH